MLTRNYDIFNDVLGLKNLIDGVLDNNRTYYQRTNLPLVNLYQKDDTVSIRVLAAGVKNEDIQLELIDNILQLSVHRKPDDNDKTYIRRERSFGTFSKSIRIPFKVNPDLIHASLKDGILTVKLFKSEDAKPRKIEII
jgi:HSP20 family protein